MFYYKKLIFQKLQFNILFFYIILDLNILYYIYILNIYIYLYISGALKYIYIYILCIKLNISDK